MLPTAIGRGCERWWRLQHAVAAVAVPVCLGLPSREHGPLRSREQRDLVREPQFVPINPMRYVIDAYDVL